MKQFSILSAALLLAACGGGGSDAPTPVTTTPPPPPPPPPAAQDFSQVEAELERFDVDDLAFIIGDAEGELYRFEKGEATVASRYRLGSASKLYTGLGVWSVVASGTMSRASNPQDFIDFWTDDDTDARSTVTVDMLLSHGSGFNSPSRRASCPGEVEVALSDCIETLYDEGLDTEPGAGFSYGPDHMQIAALMVREATGRDLRDVLREDIWDVAGASDETGFDSPSDNIRYSADMFSTTEDYAKVLQTLFAQTYFPTDGDYLRDRTDGVETLKSIRAITENGVDWHYGAGFWVECDSVPFEASCSDNPVISSPGGFGFTPWVDFETGYWAVLGMEEDPAQEPIPSFLSVQFQQVLQPIIEAEFD